MHSLLGDSLRRLKGVKLICEDCWYQHPKLNQPFRDHILVEDNNAVVDGPAGFYDQPIATAKVQLRTQLISERPHV